jgi:hypothetical protein
MKRRIPLFGICPWAGPWRISLVLGFMGVVLVPAHVYGYIDPGAAGMLSQLLYVLFYGALGVFLYMLRHLKSIVTRIKDRISMPRNSSSDR